MRILIAGGAGFVGSSLALMFKRDWPDADVRAFDNLKRRGSELALHRLRSAGVGFVHGDVRSGGRSRRRHKVTLPPTPVKTVAGVRAHVKPIPAMCALVVVELQKPIE